VKRTGEGLEARSGGAFNLVEVHDCCGGSGSGPAPPNVWHQRRAQRVRCMPGLGPRRGEMNGVGCSAEDDGVFLPQP